MPSSPLGGKHVALAVDAWDERLEGVMSKTLTSRHDLAAQLHSPAKMAAHVQACLERADGDAAVIAKAIGAIARAKGMAQVARDARLSRESLYKALSGERNPDFETILKVLNALGLTLHAKVARAKRKLPARRAARRSAPKRPNEPIQRKPPR